MCYKRTFLTAVITVAFCLAAGCSVSGLFGPASMMSIDASADLAFSDMAWNPQETRDKQDPPADSRPTAATKPAETDKDEKPKAKKMPHTRPSAKYMKDLWDALSGKDSLRTLSATNGTNGTNGSHSLEEEIGNTIASSSLGASALQPSLTQTSRGIFISGGSVGLQRGLPLGFGSQTVNIFMPQANAVGPACAQLVGAGFFGANLITCNNHFRR